MGEVIREHTITETGKTSNVTGPTWQMKAGNKIPNRLHGFLDVTQVMTTTPSITVKYQYSWDDLVWTDITSAVFTAITAVGKGQLNGITIQLATAALAAPYIRYFATIAGTGSSFNYKLDTILEFA